MNFRGGIYCYKQAVETRCMVQLHTLVSSRHKNIDYMLSMPLEGKGCAFHSTDFVVNLHELLEVVSVKNT